MIKRESIVRRLDRSFDEAASQLTDKIINGPEECIFDLVKLAYRNGVYAGLAAAETTEPVRESMRNEIQALSQALKDLDKAYSAISCTQDEHSDDIKRLLAHTSYQYPEDKA